MTIGLQQISTLAKKLAANDEKQRLKAFKNLGNFLKNQQFELGHLKYVWNGIYYLYWHSDTMAKQFQLSKQICGLEMEDDLVLEWYKQGFLILRKHWNELDYHRSSKFMNLASMMLKTVLRFLESKKFSKKLFTQWNHNFTESILDESVAGKYTHILVTNIQERGLMLYICQIYASSALEIKFENVVQFFFCFKPIFDLMSFSDNKILKKQIFQNVSTNFITFVEVNLDKEAQDFVVKKLMKYATNPKITNSSRTGFYDLIELIETSQTNLQRQAGAKSEVVGASKIGLKKKNQKKNLVKDRKKKIQKKTKALKKQKIAKKAPKIAKSPFDMVQEDKKTSEVVSSQVENVGGDQEVDSNTDYGLHKKDSKLIEFKEEMLQDEEFADLWGKLDDDIKSIIIQNGVNLPDNYFDVQDDELESIMAMQDDYENTSYEEMQKNLPKYLFMGAKQKKKYFKKVTRDYMKKVKQDIKPGSRKLKINLKNNIIKRFRKQQMVPTVTPKTEAPPKLKSILKGGKQQQAN